MKNQIKTQDFINSAKCFFLLGVFLILGCSSPSQRELRLGKEEQSQGNFRIAVNHFERVLKRDSDSELALEAAKEAAKILFLEIKDYKKAIDFYKYIILVSKSTSDRMLAQRQIVSIFFDHLSDYKAAVLEINKYLMMTEDPREIVEYKIKLARAYYYQNNFAQAQNETEEFLNKNPTSDQKFEMLNLKANIYLAQKDYQSGISILTSIIKDYPERATKDNLGLTLSVAYEEMRDFKAAIETLQKLRETHPMPEYVDIRIKRLQDRLKNQPGLNGKVRK